MCLQKQEAGQIWPAGCGLPTLDFEQQPFICYAFYGMGIWMRTHYAVLLALVRFTQVSTGSCQASWGWLVQNGLSCSMWWFTFQEASRASSTGGWAGLQETQQKCTKSREDKVCPGTVSVTSATLYLVKVSHRVPLHSKPHTQIQ